MRIKKKQKQSKGRKRTKKTNNYSWPKNKTTQPNLTKKRYTKSKLLNGKFQKSENFKESNKKKIQKKEKILG